MDERNTTGPVNHGSAATRHRLDSASAARPMQETRANEVKPAYDGPRADGPMAGQELRRSAEGSGSSRTSRVSSLLEEAWGLLANVSGGDWNRQPEHWRAAVAQWRERYFSNGDQRIERLGFDEVLRIVISGGKIARRGWNGRNQYVECQFPDEHSKMTRPYLYFHTIDGTLVPWVASQSDLLAFDWCVVREVPILMYGSSQADGAKEIG